MSDPKALSHAAVFDLDDDRDETPAPAPKKKAKRKSPTARTLEFARKQGWDAAVVEKWNPHAKVLHDLFGFVDVVVLDGRRGLLAIQATSDQGGNHTGSRMEKVSMEPKALRWLAAGLRIEVWGWKKAGPRGGVKKWTVRRFKAELVDGAIEWDDVAGPARPVLPAEASTDQ